MAKPSSSTMQRNLNFKLQVDGTKRIDQVFNLTVTLPTKLELNALENGDSIQREFELTSGILAKVSNSMILEIWRHTGHSPNPMMCLRVKLDPKSTERVGIANNSVTLSFVDPIDGTTAILSPMLVGHGINVFCPTIRVLLPD